MGQDAINYGEASFEPSPEDIKMVAKMLSGFSKLRRIDTGISGPYATQIVGFESFCDNICYTGGFTEALDSFLQRFRREGWEHESSFAKGFQSAEALYKKGGLAGLATGVWDIHNGAEMFQNE